MQDTFLDAGSRERQADAGVPAADRRFKDRIVGARGGYGEHQTRCSECNSRIHLSAAAATMSKESPSTPVVCYHCSRNLPAKPHFPNWFKRLPEILAQIDALERRHQFDRESIEVLFDLQTSAAIKLLEQFGAEKIGGSYWISRKNLLIRLNRMAQTGSFKDALAHESERRRKIADTIREAKEEQLLRRKQIPVTPESRHKNLDELDGTTLEPGRITITFESPEQALTRLMELAWAIAGDLNFEQRITPTIDEVTT